MKLEQEISALKSCYDLLSKLDDDVKVRILQWLSAKFNVGQTTVTLYSFASADSQVTTDDTAAQTDEKPTTTEAGPDGIEGFSSFTEMFKVLKPSSDAEKALTAAVYLSANRNMTEVSSAQVQKELKNIGEKVSNITQAISALVKKKFMLQLGKEGNSQQARKKYKVTPEALKVVGEMLKKRA